MTTYTTVSGDMFDSIAYRLYGSVLYTDRLIKANQEHAETYIFPSGVVLNVPPIPDDVKSSDLPPWKKVR